MCSGRRPCRPSTYETADTGVGRYVLTRSRITRLVLVVLAAASSATPLPTAASPASPADSRPAPGQPRIVPFQSGVRIDWIRRQVEADATVILREGLIELFACSPQRREHEAIVRIEARPLHLFQALGLIGITPGHPVLYDDETGRRAPAAGDPVEIEVRYPAGGQVQTVPIERWLLWSRDGRPVDRLPWVFAGSVEMRDDSIAADYEGTVVAVVDFGSSLVALPELHTDRNADLWLKPNTPAIPGVGTRCVLVFRAGAVMVALDAVGRLRVGGRRMMMAEAASGLAKLASRPEPPSVRVVVDPGCPVGEVRTLKRILEGIGLGPGAVELQEGERSEPSWHEAEALLDWATLRLMPLFGPRPSPASQPAAPDRR